MSDFTKLKSYLNESKSSIGSESNPIEKLNGLKSSVFGFFEKKLTKNGAHLTDDQMDSWIKDAESDGCCPKLVGLKF